MLRESCRRAQLAVVDLQSGGAAARSAWQMICQVSRKAYDKTASPPSASHRQTFDPAALLLRELQRLETLPEAPNCSIVDRTSSCDFPTWF